MNVAVFTTFSSALWLAVLARFASAAFGQPTISVAKLLVISVIGGGLGSVLVLLITVGLSAVSYRLGWDLDSVSTPMVTALGDMTTIPSLFLATYLLHDPTIAAVAAAISLVAAVAVTIRSYTTHDRVVRRIVVEMTGTILLTPILDVMAGGLQQARLAELTAVPVLLSLIPPFVSQAGALGGIFSSRITSKLQIGVITPRGRPGAARDRRRLDRGRAVRRRVHADRAIAWGLGELTNLPGMPSASLLIGGSLLSGLIVTPATIAAGYYLAVITYRFGLDPDNQGIPTITSVMDLAGVACILLVMTSLGVLGRDDQQPNTVKDLLVELKDASELMVDLAYAAVFFNEEKLADEVARLDERSNGHLRRLRQIAMLAARSPEDAEGMAGRAVDRRRDPERR